MELNTQKDEWFMCVNTTLRSSDGDSDAATRTSDTFKEEDEEKANMVKNVARAYFEAKVARTIAIELPDEDKAEGQDMVGKLLKSLCGTRDAALNFQKEVRKFMQSQGFVVGSGKVQLQYIHPSHGARRRLCVFRFALIAEVVQGPVGSTFRS